MSAQGEYTRLTPPRITARKGGDKLVMLTAYTAPVAQAADPVADILLVGDSLGMVLYALPSTLPVTLEMMIAHGAAVVRASQRALVVVDMPFGSYQQSPLQAFDAAARVLAQTGAGSVKLEGGVEMAETIAFLVARGIPVMGHVGLMPQRMHSLGGYRVQGRDEATRNQVLADAAAVAEAGAFALVVEAVPAALATEVTQRIAVPVIGIGGSAQCDGQVLVTEDMAGMTTGKLPRFVRRYATLGEDLMKATQRFAEDVKAGTFPNDDECY